MKRLGNFWLLFALLAVNGFCQETNTAEPGNTGKNNIIILDLFPMVPEANGYKFGKGMGLGISARSLL
jgi:hypothetical protein